MGCNRDGNLKIILDRRVKRKITKRGAVKAKRLLGRLFLIAALWGVIPMARLLAQTPAATKPDASVARDAPAPNDAGKREIAQSHQEHRFWDKKNVWLFAGVGASRTLDYFSTLNFRRRGRQEIFLTNDVVDNHAAFATVEAAGTGVSIGVAYLFHQYGHHKLERWTSIVHIGVASVGSVRNYCLKTAHPAGAPSSP